MSEVENLIDLAREGYLPADINTDDGLVSLTKLAPRTFEEVWYSDTVAAVGTGGSKVVPFERFIEQFAERRSGEHLRLIAHTSRCGSTLLANLLTLRPSSMVLKEPDFVTVPARRIALGADEAERRRYDSLLKALLNYSCHAAALATRELIIKITSWTVPLVTAALADSEDTTWLFVWREPDNVIASNMGNPSTWGMDTENGRAARHLAGVTSLATESVRFYANTWCRTVDSFLSADGGLRWRALGYQDLVNDKENSLLATERWFRLASGEEVPAAFEQVSRRYSKGPRAEVFDPARTHLRSPLEPSEAAEAKAITERTHEELLGAQRHRLL